MMGQGHDPCISRADTLYVPHPSRPPSLSSAPPLGAEPSAAPPPPGGCDESVQETTSSEQALGGSCPHPTSLTQNLSQGITMHRRAGPSHGCADLAPGLIAPCQAGLSEAGGLLTGSWDSRTPLRARGTGRPRVLTM